MENFQCTKCNTYVKNLSPPKSFNCPNGGMHSWNHLGKVGLVNYQCKKCSLLVQAENTPKSFNCPSGGMHSWSKL